MDVPPNLTLIAEVMKKEKELFWRRNEHLHDDQRQLFWTAHIAEFTSLLGDTIPIEPLNSQVATAQPKPEQQPAAMTQWTHPTLMPNSSVIAQQPQSLAYWRLTLV